jgi:hypothetical protein
MQTFLSILATTLGVPFVSLMPPAINSEYPLCQQTTMDFPQLPCFHFHPIPHFRQVEWRVQDVEDTPKPMGPDALLKSIGKKQRHRTGYDAGISLMHRASPAADFVLCDDPMPTLASHTALIFDGSDSVSPAANVVRFFWQPRHLAAFCATAFPSATR